MPADKIINFMWRYAKAQPPRVEQIEATSRDLIQSLVQKNGGQPPYKKANDVYIGNFAMLINMAAMELVQMVQDPSWNEIKEILEVEE